MTINARLLQMEWLFYEKGMQSVWNELRRIAQSTLGTGWTSGKPAGVTLLGDIELTNTTHLTTTAGQPNTGAPVFAGSDAPGWGSGQQQNPPPANIRPPTLDQP